MDGLLLSSLVLWLLGGFIAAWGASLFLRGVAARVEILAASLAKRRGKRPPTALSGGKRLVGLLVGPVVLVVGAWCVLVGNRVEVWAGETGSLRDLFLVGWWSAGSVACLVLAFAAVYVGWNYDPPRGRRRCPKCWYDFAGLTALTCPECGSAARNDDDLLRVRRSSWMIRAALVLLAASYGMSKVPDVLWGGWRAVIPTTVLIAFAERMPDHLIQPNYMFAVSATPRASLIDRLLAQRLWGWQEAWLRARAQRFVESPSSVSEIYLATILAEDWARGRNEWTTAAKEVLVAGISSPIAKDRQIAIVLLGQSQSVRELRERFVPAIVAALADVDDQTAAAAAWFMVAVPEVGLEHRKAIVSAAEVPGLRPMRCTAMVGALGVLVRHDQTVLPDLVALAEKGDASTRVVALNALLEHALPLLRPSQVSGWLRDSDARFADTAALVFIQGVHTAVFPPESLVPILRDPVQGPLVICYMSDSSMLAYLPPSELEGGPTVRYGRAAPEIVAALMSLLESGQSVVAGCAAKALAIIEPIATDALPALQRTRDRPNLSPALRMEVQNAIDAIIERSAAAQRDGE